MRVARVITEVGALDRAFDYEVTDATAHAAVGDLVRVNLHGRSVRGWIVSFGAPETSEPLKPIARWLGLGPPPEVVDLARWAAWRWAGPLARFLLAGSPSRLVKTLPPPPASNETLGGRPTAAGVVRLAPTVDPLELVLQADTATRDRAGSLVVLCPTEGWATRLTARLVRRGLAATADSDWARARAGWPIVVGARGAAFAPVPQCRGAVVLDADDEAYRSEAAPTWDAPTVLAERCLRAGAPIWLTSPSPSPRLRALAPAGDLADDTDHWPTIVVADRRLADPRQGALTDEALTVARAALESDEPVAVVVILQRLGAGRLLACRACGTLARCPRCGQAEQEAAGGLWCPFDDTTRERFCASCGRTALRVVRSGVTTLARDVGAQLAQPVSELTAKTPTDVALARVVVGTEAVLTRVRRTRAVVFADFDQYLLAPRERARRDAVLAVAKAGRLVGGRRGGWGQVVLQTRRGDDAVVVGLREGRLAPVEAEEEELTRVIGWPPFGAVAQLRGAGAAAYGAALLGGAVRVHEHGDLVTVTAPTVAALADRLADVGRPPASVRVAVE